MCTYIPSFVYFFVIITIKIIHLFKENVSIEEWGGREVQQGGDTYIYIYTHTHTHTYL